MPEKGQKTIRMWTREGFTLIGTDDGYMLGFNIHPQLEPEKVELRSGKKIKPGMKLTKIGGEKTSAGYRNIDMLPGCAIRYLGKYITDSGEDEFVCFEQVHDGHDRALCVPGFLWVCFAFQVLPTGDWMFTTPAVAARVVQTTIVEVEK